MKVAIALGTRPEIIKVSPVIRELIKRKVDFFILHTNQHFSRNMDEVFFDELKLPRAKYNLGINASNHGRMVGEMLVHIEEIFIDEEPDWVLVHGDTNTTLAGALAAAKLNIPLAHIEAGLRSYDRTMPEELNRVAVDHFSNLLFCPSVRQEMNVVDREGIEKQSVIVTGNTIVDAVHQNIVLAKKIRDFDHYKSEDYFLLTMHRPSNVDNKEIFARQIRNLTILGETFDTPIYFPMHPRVKRQLERFDLSLESEYIRVMDPVDYFEMLRLIEHAKVVLTDSGGIQEEACILKAPCITLRENTERPETIEMGANVLVGDNGRKMLAATNKMLKSKRDWYNPFGDGRASQRIVSALIKRHKPRV